MLTYAGVRGWAFSAHSGHLDRHGGHMRRGAGCRPRAHHAHQVWTLAPMIAVSLLMFLPPNLLTPMPFDRGHTPVTGGSDIKAARTSATAHPAGAAGSSVSGTFWSNHSVAGGDPTNWSNMFCDEYYPGYFCFPQAAQPSVLPLQDGAVGYAYEAITNGTTSTCPLATNNTTEVRVEFSLSHDGGQTFGAPRDLGNTTCPYYQALEPSFTVSSNGEVYGAYVEANATPAEMNCPSGCGPFWGQALWYSPRYDDALAFVSSSDSGASFSQALTVSIAGAGGIAGPSIAAFGDTVYVAYMNINNTTTSATLGGSTAPPTSAELVYSSDRGQTWHGPYVLPGYNSTEYYNAMNPQVTVGPDGTVYVAYSSNRHCIAYCAYTSQEYGDDIYLATSATNGTGWSSHLVAHDTANAEELSQTPDGVSFSNGPTTGPYLFEEGPAITLAVDPTSSNVYVAWTGALNESDHYYCGPPSFTFGYWCIYDSYAQSVLMVATSTNGGVGWTNTSVGPYQDYYQQGQPNGEFLPGLGVSPSGTVYLTYANYNGSVTSNGCYQEGSYGDYGFQGQWVATSTDGQVWTSPTLVAWNYNGNGGWWTTGWTSSVAFNVSTGAPLIGYTLTAPTDNNPHGPYQVYTWPGYVQLAEPYAGATTTLNVQSSGLPSGTPWRAWVMGNLFTSTAQNFTISNVPMDRPIWAKTGLPATSAGYGAVYLANLTLPVSNGGFNLFGSYPFLNLSGPGTFYLNYSVYYQLNFSLQPDALKDAGLSYEIYDPANNYAIWEFFANGAYGGGCQTPWYVPAGYTLHMTGYRGVGYLPAHELFYDVQGIGPVGYFNGTGTGSFTGAGPNGTITMNGPINETGWVTSYGVYDVSVGAPSIPTGSSVHFDWAGTPYSFTAPGPTRVHNVSTGTYLLSNIWASSTVAGHEYFGSSDNGNPVAVPNNPTVNLSFADVQISAPVGTVSFHANGTSTGTPWQFEFNGTIYSSSTPWINVSTRPGTFPVAGFPIVSADGTADFAPIGLSATMSVLTGTTYSIDFSRVYEVQVAPASGGSVSPSGTSYWVSPGASLSFTATPRAGYSFGGWSGKGAGSYSGSDATATVTANGPIIEIPIFYPLPQNHFSLTFTQGALPAGTPWTVFVGGTGYTTNGTTLTVPGLYGCAAGVLGTYNLSIPYVYVNGSSATRFTPSGFPATACGGAAAISVAFGAQYYLTLESTAGGIASATPASTLLTVSTSLWVDHGDTIALAANPGSGYTFSDWIGTGAGSYTGPDASAQFTVSGAVTELAVFTPTPVTLPTEYTIDLQASSSLPLGTSWSATVGNASYVTSGRDIVVTSLPAGTYSVHVATALDTAGDTQYVPYNLAPVATVGPNSTIPVTFRTEFRVDVRAAGDGSVSPSSGWAVRGTTLELAATPSAGSTFTGWSGSGNGSYSGVAASWNITVNGPILEVATFVPASLFTTPAPAGFWSSPTSIAALAAVGLAVGLGAGVALARLGRRGRREADPTGDSGTSQEGGP